MAMTQGNAMEHPNTKPLSHKENQKIGKPDIEADFHGYMLMQAKFLRTQISNSR